MRTVARALAFSRVALALVAGLLALAAGLLALAGCAGAPGPPSAAGRSPATSASPRDPVLYAAQVVQETNDVRRAKGLRVLGASVCARDAAHLRASALIGNASLTHAPLGGVIADCSPATTAAENLSRAAGSPQAVIDAWMRSPGHRSNLLDPALTEIGVSCALDGRSMLCSQVFLGS